MQLLGEALRLIRVFMGLTRIQMARKLGVSYNNVISYEQQAHINTDCLQVYEKTFGFTPEQIIGFGDAIAPIIEEEYYLAKAGKIFISWIEVMK